MIGEPFSHSWLWHPDARPECSTSEVSITVLWFLLVGVIAGWLAGVLVKGGGFGLIGDLVVGIIGALIGGLLFGGLGALLGRGVLGSILIATLGAVVLLVVLRVLKRA